MANDWDFINKSAVGIDLGTTFSSIAVYQDGIVTVIPDKDGKKLVPSVVGFKSDGREVKRLVGREVTENYSINPKHIVTEVKRLIGRRFDDESVKNNMKRWPFKVTENSEGYAQVSIKLDGHDRLDVSPEEISSIILAKLKKMAEVYLKETVKNVVISVPVQFDDSQKNATAKAAELAGLKAHTLIEEPFAGAIAYRIRSRVSEKRNILVMDVGGGTTDIALIDVQEHKFSVLANKGDNNLGGEDFDTNLVNYCTKAGRMTTKDETVMRRFRNKCEVAKRYLSDNPAEPNWSYTVKLYDIEDGADFSLKIERRKFEEINQELFDKAINLVNVCLKDGRLTAEEVDEVVPIGGSTRIPNLRKMLQSVFKKQQLHSHMNPDEAVAVGATLLAAQKLGSYTGHIMLCNVTPFSLGTDVGPKGEMDVIIPKFTTIPCTAKKTYKFHKAAWTTYEPGVIFGIFQGEKKFVKDNIYLGKFEFPNVLSNDYEIEVTFTLNKNGTLDITATEFTTKAVVKYFLNNLVPYLDVTTPLPAPPQRKWWHRFVYNSTPIPATKQPK